MRFKYWVLLCLCLVSCNQKPAEKPEALSLTASTEALQQIPFIEKGLFETAVIDPITFDKQGLNRELPVRLWYPVVDGEAILPVILFSHGNWSDREKYDNLLRFWASHGYVVVAPTHLDGRSMARGIFNSLRFGQMGLIEARVQDMQFLLEHLEALETELSTSSGQPLTLSKQSVVMAGHSFGAFTAQQFAGATAFDEGEGIAFSASDPRVAAVLAISPPGPMFEVINERSWQKMRGPVLVTTGTWDSNPQFWPDWRLHQMSYRTAVPGDQFALVIEGADHYLGNLICRPEREEVPQHDALKILNAVSVSFLNAHLRNDLTAKQFLLSQQLQAITQDFASLQHR